MSLTAFNAIFAPHHQHVQHARQSMEGAVHATLFIDSLAVGLIVPLLPFRGDEMRLSAVTFGLVTSLYGISQIIGGVIIGILADRVFGRKLALISSLLISSFGYLLLMSSNSVQSFALSRTLVGFFRHSTSLSQAMVSQTSVSPSALARLGAISSLAWTGGTALSGLLASSSAGHFAPVAVSVVLLWIGVIYSSLAIREAPVKRMSSSANETLKGKFMQFISTSSELWNRGSRTGFILLVKALLAFAALAIQGGYAKDRFALSPSSHGYLMAYSGVIAFITKISLLPTLHNRFPQLDERFAMIVAAALMALVSAAQFLTRPTEAIYMLLLLPTGLIANSFLSIHLVAAYLRQVPATDASLALGVAGVVDGLARAAVPTISGILKQSLGLQGPPLGDALLLIALVLVLLFEPPSTRPISDVGKSE